MTTHALNLGHRDGNLTGATSVVWFCACTGIAAQHAHATREEAIAAYLTHVIEATAAQTTLLTEPAPQPEWVRRLVDWLRDPEDTTLDLSGQVAPDRLAQLLERAYLGGTRLPDVEAERNALEQQVTDLEQQLATARAEHQRELRSRLEHVRHRHDRMRAAIADVGDSGAWRTVADIWPALRDAAGFDDGTHPKAQLTTEWVTGRVFHDATYVEVCPVADREEAPVSVGDPIGVAMMGGDVTCPWCRKRRDEAARPGKGDGSSDLDLDWSYSNGADPDGPAPDGPAPDGPAPDDDKGDADDLITERLEQARAEHAATKWTEPPPPTAAVWDSVHHRDLAPGDTVWVNGRARQLLDEPLGAEHSSVDGLPCTRIRWHQGNSLLQGDDRILRRRPAGYVDPKILHTWPQCRWTIAGEIRRRDTVLIDGQARYVTHRSAATPDAVTWHHHSVASPDGMTVRTVRTTVHRVDQVLLLQARTS